LVFRKEIQAYQTMAYTAAPIVWLWSSVVRAQEGTGQYL
jgi:hypothetical protein